LYRLFVAIALPEETKRELESLCNGLPGVYWRAPEQIHLTLRYIGTVDGGRFADIRQALARVASEPFELILSGVGFFPFRKTPEAIWVVAEKSDPLARLRERVETALAAGGVQLERKRFRPHVTLGRFAGNHSRGNNYDRMAAWLARFSLFRARPVAVGSFGLFSSARSSQGPSYRLEEEYPLSTKGVQML
jgi:2'-5' RNA ligase